MHAVLPAMMVAVALALACACVAHTPPAVTAPAPKSKTEPRSEWREMTWSEYYSDVREKAWRSNVSVVWINPPNVRRPSIEQPTQRKAR